MFADEVQAAPAAFRLTQVIAVATLRAAGPAGGLNIVCPGRAGGMPVC